MSEAAVTAPRSRKKDHEICLEPCSIEKAMRLIGGKWKGSILFHLKDGPVRFNELSRMLGGASKKMIDQRLKELEGEGMVLRKVMSDRPIAVSYELTPFGQSALGILNELKKWSEEYEV
ncbi:winged helix-turn-helix transcriptional regulator [Parendozoicomonas haliclonae]|uniref:Putative HTH-type transcriptional regulator YybR n=1 Tax=Parendozoicomonas haliclonae TaxID=1960125 RepID=A0A1X7AJ82_9GAMM|nr:helix-turn-helix domain-containing protein [Parendozoicomonas haliclonae]SMA45413.1 putative HTH-type transcriptional regulator YybR [Parendozoicomonas haliclonae]